MPKNTGATKVKSVSESEIVLSQVMMPVHANHYGSVHVPEEEKGYQYRSLSNLLW